MDYLIRRNSNIVTCFIEGEITFDDQDAFHDMIAHAIKTNDVAQVRLDFSELNFIDSAGVGMLLVAQDQSIKENWTFTVINPNGRVHKMLNLAKLSEIINIENT